MAQCIFWSAVGIVAYIYVGYPLTLALLPRARRRLVPRDSLPTISVLIAAFNEERHIRATVENKLAADYPEELLEVIVISDGSTDGTDNIVRSMECPRLRLLRQESRQGKTRALDQGIAVAKGEILVFADANSLYERRAIRELVSEFEDSTVGYVSGLLCYRDPSGTVVGEGSGFYIRYDSLLRKLESRAGTAVAVNGGIDAVRKSLFQPMRPDQLPDFVLPLRVIEQGYRVVYCPRAVMYEDALQKSTDEFRMRVRVCLRTYNALWDLRRLLAPTRGKLAFQLFFHKVLRYLVFAFLLTAVVANTSLTERPLYFGTAVCQGIFYLMALIGPVLERFGCRGPLVMPYYFVVVNAAAAVALVSFLRGQRQATWTPRKGA